MTRAFLLPIALALSACATHQIVDGDPANSPNQTLNNFHVAASRGDYEAYFANWSDKSVFLGTDATERWEGKQFKDFAKPYFDKGQGWTYLPRDRHFSVSPDGNTMWFDELLDNEKYGQCRGSGVLLRSGSGWTIAQYNLSFPIPNDLAADVTATVKKWHSQHTK